MTNASAGMLERAFHEAMLGVYHSALNECGYRAARFFQMVNERGGLQSAKDLLHSSGYSEGLTTLWEHKRLDISMEALVLRDPWSQLFTEEELATARRRLDELEYDRQ